MVYCDNHKCIHNNNLMCTSKDTYYVGRLCVTHRRRPKQEDYQSLMQTSRPNCHKSGGKYRADHANVIK